MVKEIDMQVLERLPEKDREEIRNILTGKLLPSLHADIIAKRIFHPDVHPERLNFLMRGISKDPTIEVRSGAGNEAFRQSVYSKGMVTDIPSWLKDSRAADLEIQKIGQAFLFTRLELYAADSLLLQYSVKEGQKKGDLDYGGVKEVLFIVLMAESPKEFIEYDQKCDKYIHRFTRMTADTGISYLSKAKFIYVQLDKCLEQFKNGTNAEAEDGKPDKLQGWLASIADVNDPQVLEFTAGDRELEEMRKEANDMVQDKDVLWTMIQNKYDRMDWVTSMNQAKEEGIEKGIEKGTLDTLTVLVQKNLLSLEDAAAEAGMTEAAFRLVMNTGNG